MWRPRVRPAEGLADHTAGLTSRGQVGASTPLRRVYRRYVVVGSAESFSCDTCGAVGPVWIVQRPTLLRVLFRIFQTACAACFFSAVASGVRA